MSQVIGNCELCLNTNVKLVNSHIIPKSFYERGQYKLVDSDTKRTKKLPQGIYGQFLCFSCEGRFQQIDDCAFNLIKSSKKQIVLIEVEEVAAKIIPNALQHKDNLHKFCLSILWRAATCKRTEYQNIDIGCYNEKIRIAILNDGFSADLLGQTGAYIWEYRHSNVMQEVDAAFITYRNGKNSEFGKFRFHLLGYPYGEICIRLGGENPKMGYMKVKADNNQDYSVVSWSTSLSTIYPNLLVSKAKRVNSNGNIFPSTDDSIKK